MSFDYIRAESLPRALQELASGNGKIRILAGGTDLLVATNQGRDLPSAVLDITFLEELETFNIRNGGVELGALITHSRVCADEVLRERAAALVQACREIGSPQIQNRGTLAGNLANASPAADTIPPLVVYGAVLTLAAADGERKVKVEDFCAGVKKSVLRPGEMIVGISFPLPAENCFSFFKKLGQRKAMNISKVSAAGCLELDGSRVASARLALGAVAPTVVRVRAAEEYLAGKELTGEVIGEAAALARRESRAISDIRSTADYRDRMAGVLLADGLREAASSLR